MAEFTTGMGYVDVGFPSEMKYDLLKKASKHAILPSQCHLDRSHRGATSSTAERHGFARPWKRSLRYGVPLIRGSSNANAFSWSR
jgi:hypothetical protein